MLSKKKVYLKVKIDGLPIPKGRLVKGPKINQYVGTVPSTFQLLYLVTPGWSFPTLLGGDGFLQLISGKSRFVKYYNLARWMRKRRYTFPKKPTVLLSKDLLDRLEDTERWGERSGHQQNAKGLNSTHRPKSARGWDIPIIRNSILGCPRKLVNG